MTLDELPADIPAPVDDGSADHLRGMHVPPVPLPATSGGTVDLAAEGSPWAVVYVYPMTGRPDQELPADWDRIPGARGCTPQTCAFRDHQGELSSLGADVFGLSVQPTEYQQEMVARLNVEFPVLSDADRAFGDALGLPTMEVGGMTLYKRLTMIIRRGRIEHVFYPVFPPDENAAEALRWLQARVAPKVDATAAWDTRYSAAAELYGAEPNQFVAASLTGLAPRRVLDMGCGQGRNSVWLAAQGHSVTGLDLSPVGIGQARALAEQMGVAVDFAVCDIAGEYEPDASYDLVLLSYLQLPPDMRTVVHRKAIESLAPGGEIFLVAHHADNLAQGVGGPPMPEVLFDEGQLAEDFGAIEILRNEKVLRQVERDGVTRVAHDVMLRARRSR